ncbi:MAG: MobA/MobL family protein [Nitrosospira sp.]|nr:MobA/MobL family protein [Nitrosospira sp.]
MAIGRLSMKVGKTGRAGPHAAYIAREGQYIRYLERGEKLEASEAGNLPAWAEHDPLIFWQAADAFERSNGTTYREMEIALPRELETKERIELAGSFVAQEIGERHAYQWAIHTPLAADGKEQPHVHLMFSERQVDGIERDPQQYFKRYNARHPEQGGARKGYGPHAGQTLSHSERTADLKELRGRWQDMANEHLQQLGYSVRIDMKSHTERHTGLEPEMKQLPSQWRGEGRENVLEFRQARAELVQAQAQVQQTVPDVPAQIISLEAERERRVRVQERAKQARIERMSSTELRAEIEHLRPPEVSKLVNSDPEVMAARQACESLSGHMKQAQITVEQSQQATAAWRMAHPLRAKAHDLGLVQSTFLIQQENIGEATWAKGHELFLQVNDARQHARFIENAAESRIRVAQMPMREHVGKLEQTWQQKIEQEQVQQRRELNLNQALSSLKTHARLREIKAHGYTDAGEKWRALPEKARSLINDYNRQPEKMRPQALERLREHLKQNPYAMEKLAQELELARGRGRSRSQGMGIGD